MSVWDDYPTDYRQREVEYILSAVASGECVSVAGLSGAGKSNLLGFIAHRASQTGAHLPEENVISSWLTATGCPSSQARPCFTWCASRYRRASRSTTSSWR